MNRCQIQINSEPIIENIHVSYNDQCVSIVFKHLLPSHLIIAPNEYSYRFFHSPAVTKLKYGGKNRVPTNPLIHNFLLPLKL